MGDMLLYYVQTNAFCLILFLIIFLDIMRKEITKDQKMFYMFIIDSAVFCVADLLNYVLMGRNGPYIAPMLYIVNTIYFSTSVLASYTWFLYTLEKLGTRRGQKHIIRHALSIPILIFIAITSLSPILGWIFTITPDNNYVRGSALWIHWIMAWGFIAASTILTTIHLVKERDRIQRRQIYPLYTFAIFPVVASVIQIFVPSSSLIQVGMVLSAIIVYIKVQDNHVNTDALTGLYNRIYFDKYLLEKVKLMSNNTPLFLLMMDVDNLKGVNSVMGRTKGDEVLKNVAYIIKKISQRYNRLMISRYDNDEFAMFGYFYDVKEIKEMIMLIKDEIRKFNLNSSYSFDVSIGFVKGTKESFINVDQIVDLADIEMHKAQEEKLGVKRARN